MSGYEIDLDLAALVNNVEIVKRLAPKQKVLAIVKANAYGHGVTTCATVLQHHVHAFGVVNLTEARFLRAAGITTRIVLMMGFATETELKMAQALQCEILLHSFEQLAILENTNVDASIQIWVKINTGLNRLGFKPEELSTVIKRIHKLKIKKPLIYLTHLANADDVAHKANLQQIKLFAETAKYLTGEKSICNSAGILAFPDAHADWVRPGVILYGASPFKDKLASHYQLQPVMNVYARIIAVYKLKKGDKIGYGSAWECSEDQMPIGIVPVGYADGYPRYASGTPVYVAQSLCQLAGRVSMNMLAIDLRNAPQAKVGTQVVLWGKDLPVELVANYLETIPHNLLAGIR